MAEEIKRRLEKLVPPRSQWTPVDEALYGNENVYWVETERAEQFRFEALKFSFKHHYTNNAFYQRFCQGEGITPDDIKEPQDLVRIPLIPDTFFKDYPTGAGFYSWLQKITTGEIPAVELKSNRPSFEDVMEALQEQNFTVTFTSGSSGRFSFFPRNALTWMRQKYCFAIDVAEIIWNEYEAGNPNMVCLSAFANPEKTFLFTGRISTAVYGTLFDPENVDVLTDRKMTTDSLRIAMGRTNGIKEKLIARLAKSGQKRVVENFSQRLEAYVEQGRKVLIAGPPVMIEALLSTLELQGKKLQLGENGWVITGGGWKVATGGAMLGERWRERVKDILGLPDERCRDNFGMSECSAFFPSCEGHYKHIPISILYPMVLDDELKPLDYGNYGRFAFLDPVPSSYPGYIITGDRVKILKSCPACNRPGPVIEPDISRIGGAEDRGCAAIAGDLMSRELNKTA